MAFVIFEIILGILMNIPVTYNEFNKSAFIKWGKTRRFPMADRETGNWFYLYFVGWLSENITSNVSSRLNAPQAEIRWCWQYQCLPWHIYQPLKYHDLSQNIVNNPRCMLSVKLVGIISLIAKWITKNMICNNVNAMLDDILESFGVETLAYRALSYLGFRLR